MEDINWNTVSAIASSIIAIAALVFSIYSFTTQQNRAEKFALANVKPILKIRTLKYEIRKSILIINHGLGPAIITKAEFSKDDKKTNNIVELFDLPIKKWESFINVPNGTVIRAQDERILILQTKEHLEAVNRFTDEEASKILALWQKQKSGIKVVIEYKDVLGTQQDSVVDFLN